MEKKFPKGEEKKSLFNSHKPSQRLKTSQPAYYHKQSEQINAKSNKLSPDQQELARLVKDLQSQGFKIELQVTFKQRAKIILMNLKYLFRKSHFI